MTKKTLFLLHGLCASSDVWQPLVQQPFIQERFSICHLEYPLHLEKVSFESLVQYFKAEIEKHGAKDGVLCGHSLGGHIGIRIGHMLPALELILIQCSPAQDLQDLFSYFKPCAALEYLYQEKWNVLEQEIIESHLFNSFESGHFRLLNDSWRRFRRDLSSDLNQGDFPDEVALLKDRHAKACLILTDHDALLATGLISQRLAMLAPNLKIVHTLGRDHYAFYDSTELWFGSDVKQCFDQ